MGIAERREREKIERKKSIVDAAERVFIRKGFENATMDDVAEMAELSKGTLYLYFNTKQQLYLEFIVRGNELMGKMFSYAVKKHRRGYDQVLALGRAYLEFAKKYPKYYEAFMYIAGKKVNLDGEQMDHLKEFYETDDTFSVLVNSITRGIQDGSIRRDLHPMKTALVLWGQIAGLVQLVSSKGEIMQTCWGEKPEEVIEYYFDFVKPSLEPR
jgi:TetR/AcrR family transcriptional regulator